MVVKKRHSQANPRELEQGQAAPSPAVANTFKTNHFLIALAGFSVLYLFWRYLLQTNTELTPSTEEASTVTALSVPVHPRLMVKVY